MSNTQHTPGPWEIRGEYSRSQDEIKETSEGRSIAVVWTRNATSGSTARTQFKDIPELKANARLIAAAPDLLEACKAALQCQLTGLDENTVDALEAALAKAEGKA